MWCDSRNVARFQKCESRFDRGGTRPAGRDWRDFRRSPRVASANGGPAMFELKTLSPEAIGRSLEKAERYRLLNEPEEAESICLDVLAIAADNRLALVTLLLALTDQFPHAAADAIRRAQELIPRLDSDYDRAYYAGIICERRANARLAGQTSGSQAVAFHLYRQAMP